MRRTSSVTLDVMDYKPFAGTEQLVRNHQGSDGVVRGASAGVANHMGVAFGKACIFRGVQAGIHAGEDRKSTRRWQRQVSFLAPKPDAYFLLAATTSSTISDIGPLSDHAPVSELYACRFRV
jgi:hypothetical protein